MNETAVQLAIQAILQDMDEFSDADVVINDWGILDQESINAPYVIISDAVNVSSRQDTSDEQVTYGLPLVLIERFDDWKTSLDNIRNRRQAIFNTFTGNGNERSAGGLEGFTINVVRTEGPIEQYYDRGLTPEQMAVATPAFLQQTLVLECEEF